MQRSDRDSGIQKIFPIDFHWPTMDPFLFCAYHKDDYPPGNADFGPQSDLTGRELGMDFQLRNGFRMYHGTKIPGFPAHPHRGFETVTIVTQGIIDHADSLGAAGRYGSGDTQWMTAGRGIQHSEMFPLLDNQQKNPLELFQIWINLPKARKFVDPHFTMLWDKDTAKFRGAHGEVRLIAGALGDLKSPEPPPNSWARVEDNHVWIWHIKLVPAGKFVIPRSVRGLSRALYFCQGEKASFAATSLEPGHGMSLDSDRDFPIVNEGKKDISLLLLQGRPIEEPVVQRGPFVMNSEIEIKEAFADFRNTQFGGWPWPREDMVHGIDQKRFASLGPSVKSPKSPVMKK